MSRCFFDFRFLRTVFMCLYVDRDPFSKVLSLVSRAVICYGGSHLRGRLGRRGNGVFLSFWVFYRDVWSVSRISVLVQASVLMGFYGLIFEEGTVYMCTVQFVESSVRVFRLVALRRVHRGIRLREAFRRRRVLNTSNLRNVRYVIHRRNHVQAT